MISPTDTLLDRARDFFRTPLIWVMPEPAASLKKISPLYAVHSFRPEVLALHRMGIKAESAWPEVVPAAVALTLPRQTEWACGLIAQALEKLPPNGILMACARNDRGGKRYAALLEEYFGSLWSEAKNHCRLVAIARPETLPAIVADWRAGYVPKAVAGTEMQALPGSFSAGHIDKGSALLAQHLPLLSGRVADFGAGWGYLSRRILESSPLVQQLDLFEADANALVMARENLNAWRARTGFFWHDILSEPCPHGYDAVVMNPPFHDLQDPDPSIGRGFITAAAAALKQGGALWMVANRHLPYEETVAASFSSWRSVADADGFKILTATR